MSLQNPDHAIGDMAFALRSFFRNNNSFTANVFSQGCSLVLHDHPKPVSDQVIIIARVLLIVCTLIFSSDCKKECH